MRTKREDMNAFYKVVDTLCAKKGMSHCELADAIGISNVTLSRYLTGQRAVQLSPFMSMCRVLEINPESLYKTYLFARMETRVANYRAEHEGERA